MTEKPLSPLYLAEVVRRHFAVASLAVQLGLLWGVEWGVRRVCVWKRVQTGLARVFLFFWAGRGGDWWGGGQEEVDLVLVGFMGGSAFGCVKRRAWCGEDGVRLGYC